MVATVVYQETKNNFKNIRQTINQNQIVSIKSFKDSAPDSMPDFIGQLGLCSDLQGRPLLFIASLSGLGPNGWDLINIPHTIADHVVTTTKENEFEKFNQTIQGAQISCMTYGSKSELLEPILGEGHMYVNKTDINNPKLFVSVKSGGNLEWKEVTSANDLPDHVVQVDKPNNFTDNGQTINHLPISTFWSGSLNPSTDFINATRAGIIYMQIPEATQEAKPKFWVSRVKAGPNDFVWEFLNTSSGGSDLPETVVQTNKTNNFQPYEQKISGKQILSFVDGGDKPPHQSQIPADYDGQLYISTKKVQGNWDVAIWVARGNTWIPLLGSLDNTFARLDTSNVFKNPVQSLGELQENRFITGCRVKRGNLSPVADSHWKATVEGETTIFINTGTSPEEVSVWTALKVNPSTSNVGEWRMTWSSVVDQGLPTNVALVDKVNTFIPLQKIGGQGNEAFITGCRTGTTSPKGQVVPLTWGEVYVRHLAGLNSYEIWMATEEGDTDSWQQLLDEVAIKMITDQIVDLQQEDDRIKELVKDAQDDVDALEHRMDLAESELDRVERIEMKVLDLIDKDVAIDAKIGEINIEIDELGALSNKISADLAGVEGDVENLNLKDDVLEKMIDTNIQELVGHDSRINDNTRRIGVLEHPHKLVDLGNAGQVSKVHTSPLADSASEIASDAYHFCQFDTIQELTLPTVVPHDTVELLSGQIREGRITTINNIGKDKVTLKPSPGFNFVRADASTSREEDIAAGSYIVMKPTLAGGVKRWHIITLSTMSGGNSHFLHMTDTPESYAGQAGNVLQVNATETGLEFIKLNLGGGVPPDYDSIKDKVNKNVNDILQLTDDISVVNETLGTKVSPVDGTIWHNILDHETRITTNKDDLAKVVEGNKKISVNAFGHETVYTSSDVSVSSAALASMVFMTPDASNRKCYLPEIVSNKHTSDLTNKQVRAGRTLTVINASNTHSLVLHSKENSASFTQKIYNTSQQEVDTFTLLPQTSVVMSAGYFDSGNNRKWCISSILKDNSGSLTDLQAQLDSEKVKITDLQSEFVTEKGKISTLETKMVDVETKAESNRVGLETEKGRVDALQTKTDENKTSIDSLRTELDAEKVKTTDLRSELDAEKTKIEALRAEVDALSIWTLTF